MAECRYVSVAEVKETLIAKNEERGELIPSLKAAMTAANETCALTSEQANELIAKIAEIIEPLELTEYGRDTTPVKVADTLPKSPAEVRALFSKERGVVLPPEMIQQILDTVNDYSF